MNKFKCPICSELMTSIKGTQLDQNDGMTLFCSNKKCSAQEVVGHGRNEQSAYEIVLLKYKN